MSVLVVLEQRAGKWNRMSFEALAAGQKIGASSRSAGEAVVLGSGIDDAGERSGGYELSKVFAIDHAVLADYTPEAYTAA